MGIRPV